MCDENVYKWTAQRAISAARDVRFRRRHAPKVENGSGVQTSIREQKLLPPPFFSFLLFFSATYFKFLRFYGLSNFSAAHSADDVLMERVC